MATPKPGEIRCPTCHRSTPPAAFCTQCGSAIPSDARIRPRGMDRDELQERIRARRSGGDPYRRGGMADDESVYQRYEPDPNDAAARREQRAAERRQDLFHAGETEMGTRGAPPSDEPELTRDRDDWSRPSAPAQPGYGPPPTDVPAGDEPAYIDNYDDAAYADEAYQYEYEDWDRAGERRSGAGAFAILGFLALGVVALLGGALLAGLFGSDPNLGQTGDSPTPSASVPASAAESASASVAPSTSAAPDASPAASGDPVVFPDGFSAEAQPCLPGSAGGNGCDSNGVNNNGVVDIWVGFENGVGGDVIGATLVPPEGPPVDGSIDLADIGCTQSCNGWTYFPFRNLTPGTYEVQITRNGEPAGSTSFEVS